MMRSKPAWRTIALITAVGFFWVATRNDVYDATSPRGLAHTLFGSDIGAIAHPWWLSLHIWLRKAYSIVAFMLVGFTAHRALGATSRPILRAVAIVSGYSLGIEIAQRLFTAPEPFAENVLDVACGAVGGWLAILADRAIIAYGSTRARQAANRPASRLQSRKNP